MKFQSTSFKSGPSVKFGQSHRVVDFRPDVVQLLINPVAEKKLLFIAVLVAAKEAPHYGCQFWVWEIQEMQ